jgi:ubiquinone/menaquinone biosynthesis C-methylase UbiE
MPNTDHYTDREQLIRSAYATDAPFMARLALQHYQQPPRDFVAWALHHVAWTARTRILDCGCGNGRYLRHTIEHGATADNTIGLDIAAGMLDSLRHRWPSDLPRPYLVVGDVAQLPLPTNSCDLAYAMHMLYHVPDQQRAVAELRRVVRPGGTLLVATNSQHDKQELGTLFDAAIAALAGHTAERAVATRFSLEHGAALLQTQFADVQRYDFTATIVLPEAAPAVAYMESMRATTEATLPAPLSWEAVIAEFERQVRAHIDRHGAFRLRVHRGVFVCR